MLNACTFCRLDEEVFPASDLQMADQDHFRLGLAFSVENSKIHISVDGWLFRVRTDKTSFRYDNIDNNSFTSFF